MPEKFPVQPQPAPAPVIIADVPRDELGNPIRLPIDDVPRDAFGDPIPLSERPIIPQEAQRPLAGGEDLTRVGRHPGAFPSQVVLDAKAAADKLLAIVGQGYGARVPPEAQHMAAFATEVCGYMGLEKTPVNVSHVTELLVEHGIEPHVAQEYPKWVDGVLYQNEEEEKAGPPVKVEQVKPLPEKIKSKPEPEKVR